MVESFLGAPIVIDAPGLGFVAHRARRFWMNWCRPKILQLAILTDILPYPLVEKIIHPHQVPTELAHAPRFPFASHDKVGQPRICMPTIVGYLSNHAYRLHANGKPGEGQP